MSGGCERVKSSSLTMFHTSASKGRQCFMEESGSEGSWLVFHVATTSRKKKKKTEMKMLQRVVGDIEG